MQESKQRNYFMIIASFGIAQVKPGTALTYRNNSRLCLLRSENHGSFA
jgi:hypothetical protein